jgi:hypothetical protein
MATSLVAWLDNVSFAVIASAGITAAVQAGAALVGFLIACMPSPYFFTLVTFFSSPLVMVLSRHTHACTACGMRDAVLRP